MQGAQHIAEGLAANKTLVWIGLGGNGVDVEGAWALAEGLRGNMSLQWLAMGGNMLGDRGAMHLATVLASKGKMRYESLSL